MRRLHESYYSNMLFAPPWTERARSPMSRERMDL
jgi:hypothetical protein